MKPYNYVQTNEYTRISALECWKQSNDNYQTFTNESNFGVK